MKKKIILLLLVATSMKASAQSSFENILIQIEDNNMGLQALRLQADADKIGNQTDIFLEDPEIGFNYLWGSPEGLGNRQDISMSQKLDIAILSGLKSRVGKSKNSLVEWQYRADRMDVLLQARLLMLDLTYCNGMIRELDNRRIMALALVDNQKKRLDNGDVNMIEYNNVKLDFVNVEAEIRRFKAEKDALLMELKSLNGGKTVEFEEQEFLPIPLPVNFDDWYTEAADKNPWLGYVKSEVELSRQQLKLAKAQNLPLFSVGYMSEKTVGERYRGVMLGVSIPLWGNKNKVRQARADCEAAQMREKDAHQQFYGRLQTIYQRTQGLRESAVIYRKSLVESDNRQLLKKALEMGEISMMDYLLQISRYYDAVEKTLSAERDFQKSVAELTAVTTL